MKGQKDKRSTKQIEKDRGKRNPLKTGVSMYNTNNKRSRKTKPTENRGCQRTKQIEID